MKFNRSGESVEEVENQLMLHDCKWTELWRDRKGTEGARQATAQTLR